MKKFLKIAAITVASLGFAHLAFTQSTIITSYLPIYPMDGTKFLNGVGVWAVPAGTSGTNYLPLGGGALTGPVTSSSSIKSDTMTATNGGAFGVLTTTSSSATFNTSVALANFNDYIGASANQSWTYGASLLSTPSAIRAGLTTSTKGFQAYQGTLTHAGSVALDFDAAQTVNSITVTGNLTLTFSNLDTNRNYRLLIKQAQATNCTLSLPAGTMGYYTATLSNGWHMLSAESWGTVASNVWISTSSNGTY